MKKLLSLLSLLLIGSIGVWAQSWSNPHTNQPAGQTIIYADLTTNVSDSRLTIAAFVDGECRFSSEYQGATITGNDDVPFLKIVVPGGYDDTDDDGKAITFKAYDNVTGGEYDLTCNQTITYGNEATYGVPPSSSANRVKLSLTIATEVTMQSPFSINVGETIDLNTLITVTPSDAQLPQNGYWSNGNAAEFASIDGSMMTGVKITTEYQPVRFICPNANLPIVSGEFNVLQSATSINIVTPEFTVEKNNAVNLSDFMYNIYMAPGQIELKAYELVPADATDAVKWELKDDGIIVYSEQDQVWTPVKGGTTQIRPYIEKSDGTKLYPSDPEWITVNVIVPVSGITLSNFTGTESYCNVGDDIYQWIASRVTILPEDATDKTYTITEVSNNVEGLFTISDGAVVADTEGYTAIRIRANGGTDNTVIWLDMTVYNPAKEIILSSDKLSYTTNTEADVVKSDVESNISWSPEGSTPEGSVAFDGIFSQWYGSFDHGSFHVEDGDVNVELTPSTNTATVTLSWNDYSNYDGTDESIVTESTTKTFQIVISKGLQGFTITIIPDEDPRSGTIILTPQPEDAVCDWNDYDLEIYDEYGSWERSVDLSYDYRGEGSYEATLPGSYTIKVLQNGGGYVSEETFEVPYVAEYAAGWQWRSNPYGALDGDLNTFESVFGDAIIEARTYDEQVYNDPSWGIWGSLSYIDQYQMYKVNMASAKLGLFYGGSILKQNLQGTLRPGWNWVGCPYFYNRSIEDGKYKCRLDIGPEDGFVIVSKNSGSSEYIHDWFEGDLEYLEPGQGYLVYNPYETDKNYEFLVEVGSMTEGDEGYNAAHAPARGRKSIWNYDHTRFANNMTMVAEFDVLPNAEDWSLGAFVGDECRGEGHYVNGKFFITVHTNGGEQVSFRLYNTATDEYCDVDQTVKTVQRMGSLRAPVKLSSQAVVTGIEEIENAETSIVDSSSAIYNQNGVRQQQMRRGVNIVRMADGTVKKILVK